MLRNSLFILFALLVYVLPVYTAEAVITDETRSMKPTKAERQNTDKNKIETYFSRELKNTFADQKATGEAKRLEVKTLLEQRQRLVDQQKLLLRNRLQTFKDQNKSESVLRIDTKIASISSKRSENMNDAVIRLTTILDTIKYKSSLLDSNCETTNLIASINEAETAITGASTAIETQAQKTYPLNITDETTAKQNIGTVLKQLQTDLRNTHKTVLVAKQSVVKAAVELNKTKNCARVSVTPIPVTVSPTTLPVSTLSPTQILSE